MNIVFSTSILCLSLVILRAMYWKYLYSGMWVSKVKQFFMQTGKRFES